MNRIFLKNWCNDNNLKVYELAEKLGITRNHLSQCISGKSSFSKATAIKIVKLTGFDFEKVMCGEESENKKHIILPNH